MITSIFRSILILVGSIGIAAGAVAQTYDARTDFSTAQNPNGVWTYGWSYDLSGPLVIYPQALVSSIGAPYWTDPSISAEDDPNIAYYPGDTTNGYIPAHSLSTSPGPRNQFSHCIWTAPTAGVYSIKASFIALWVGAPHGYLLENGTSIGGKDLTKDVPLNYSFSSVSLAAGDTIDAVVGVGADGSFGDDQTEIGLTITGTGAGFAGGSPVPGTFVGLITGTGGPDYVEGEITARVGREGGFSGQLRLENGEFPLEGVFSYTGRYSTTISLKDGSKIPLSLNFASNGTLTGTGSFEGAAFSLTAGAVSDTTGAGGRYTFTVSPAETLTSSTAPEGTGFGYMNVSASGEVSMVGSLGDGTGFATASWITSGSSVPIYVNMYGSGGIGGTLVFRDVPQTSDCDGTLYWLKPATQSHGAYAQGFDLAINFQGAQFNRVIGGLSRDVASLDASGADLLSDFSSSVTLEPNFPIAYFYGGAVKGLRVSIHPETDRFFGSFKDSTTGAFRSFTGVVLPKSRSGAGYFYSGGLSGSVNIEY